MMNNVTVVKFGSDLVTDQDGIDIDRIKNHISKLYKIEKLVIVTSGAVVTGKALFRSSGQDIVTKTSDNDLKFFAGLGCTEVFHAFEKAFRECGRLAASYPITHNDLDDSSSFLSALRLNLEKGVVTVLNEADAFSQTELMQLKTGGDNDGLAAHVAKSIDADELILVTEYGGVVDDSDGLIKVVDSSNISAVRAMVETRRNSGNGRGGIASKLEAAWAAAQSGVDSKITDENYQTTTKFMIG
ncbi:hypothetical protein KA021_02875 [Candidatus Saccharibacteria bacterium]|jgi:glutamate 5-kinase|nr:hypothetical protein [Candidatus Saccharibacteria bacterium]MDQ5913336.1 glutamate 5-kinase [Patescibacteria group bacterium]